MFVQIGDDTIWLLGRNEAKIDRQEASGGCIDCLRYAFGGNWENLSG